MSIRETFEQHEDLIWSLYEKETTITEVAKKLCEKLGIEYSDSHRRTLSKFLEDKDLKLNVNAVVPEGGKLRAAWGKPGSMMFSYRFDTQEAYQDTFRQDLINDIKQFSPTTVTAHDARTKYADCLLEICMPDLHNGRITQAEFKQMFESAFWSIIHRARNNYDISKVIFPAGNDYSNSDGITYATTRGTKQFDYQKWYESFRFGWQLLANNISQLSQMYPVEVPIVVGNHDKCHDEKTELLTSKGFISYKEITEDTLIATIDPKTKETVYQRPTDIFTMHHDGIMHRYENRYTDCLVSPNHRLMVRRPQDDYYSFVKSKDFTSSGSSFFRISGENHQEDYPIHDDWLRLFAWINSDGSIDKRGNIKIYQVEGEKEKRIRELLDRLDIHYHEYFRERKVKAIAGRDLIQHTNKHWVFTLNQKHSSEALAYIYNYLKDKYTIPEILYRCSSRQIEVYIDEYILGDGTRKSDDASFSIYGVKSMLDQLQHLLVTNGYYAKVKKVSRDGSYVLYSHKKETMYAPEKRIENYKGEIWCVEVPNSNFFTRRNGKIAIHGNSVMFYMGDVLSAYFHNSDVQIDNRFGVFKHFVFGNNMVMYDHGEVKSSEYPLIMATEYPKEFGDTIFREVHTGHFHKEKLDEYRGVKVRYLPSLAPNSDWENERFKHIRQAQGLVWHKEHGLIGIINYNIS